MITIDIVSDTICPWCFIGKRRLERTLAARPPEEEFRVAWHPYQLNPDMPPGGVDRAEYTARKFGGAEQGRQVYERIRAAGRGEGIEFDFERMERTPNTVDSHRLIRLAGAGGCQDAVVEALFRAAFLDGRDVGDREVLVAVGAGAGLDAGEVRGYLESDTDVDQVRAEDAHARRMDIQGVPFFIVGRRFGISGAQEPSVFHAAFERLAAGED